MRPLACLVLGVLGACSAANHAPIDLAIRGATILDMLGALPIADRTILIDDGRIVGITASTDSGGVFATETIDATGKFVMPSLADMHVHFGSGGLGHRRPDATGIAIRQFLRYGVTTVLNVGGTGGNRNEMRAVRERQRRGDLPNLQVFATGEMLTLPGSHPVATIMKVPEGSDPATYDWSNRGVALVTDSAEARSAVAKNLNAGMDGIKIIVESGPTEFGDHPQMPPDMISAVVDEADKRGSFVVAHISSLDEFEDCIDAGVRAIIHAVSEPPWPEARHWEAMKAKGIYYVPTLSLYGSLLSTLWADPATSVDPFLTTGVDQQARDSTANFDSGLNGPDAANEWRQILESVKSAHDAGVLLTLGTDTNNPRVFPGYSVHRELETYVALGLTPAEALIAATRRAAQLLGREADFGTIEVGKRADLLILTGNPLNDIRNTRTIEAVFIAGIRVRDE